MCMNSRHYCECGCEKEIIWKQHYRWRGHSKYIHGHNPTKPNPLRGKDNPNWKGGILKDGKYIKERSLSHPHSDGRGYVRQHRLVMERHLGRYLASNEIVHHVNGIGNDNRIENLVLTNTKEHVLHHLAYSEIQLINNYFVVMKTTKNKYVGGRTFRKISTIPDTPYSRHFGSLKKAHKKIISER